VSILSRVRRIFRRGIDEESTAALIDMLAQRGVIARQPAEPRQVLQTLSLAAGSRTLAVAELGQDEAPLRYVVVSRIGGEAAGHLGRITVTGLHVILDRQGLPEQWPSRWATTIQAQPSESRSDIGEVRDFVWRPVDATGSSVSEVVALLTQSERVTRWVDSVLREQSTVQVEVAPTASRVRVAAHQSGEALPQPRTVEAMLTVARAIAGK